MSILDDTDHVDFTNFNGPNLIEDEEDVTEPQSLYCRNSEYVEGQVRTRRGFDRVWNPNVIVWTLYNWIQQQYNRLIYFKRASNTTGTVVSRDLLAATEVTVLSGVAGILMTFAQAGYRLYMAFADTSGYGSVGTKVWDGTLTTGVPNVDDIFPESPLVAILNNSGTPNYTWWTTTEPAAGSITAGLHLLFLVFTTWSGAQAPPGPSLTGGAGSIVRALFVAAGSKNLRLQFSPASTWPLNLKSVQVAMTTATNYNRVFLVPSANGGGPQDIPRGSNTTMTFVIDIDDVTLTGGGPTEITNTLFNLFTFLDYTPPLANTSYPHCVLGYNNRNAYLWRQPGPDGTSIAASILVSDQYKPQWVILSRNQLTLPESRDAITMFALGATLYVLGPSWTYAFSDNNQIPVNWAPPRQVSGDIGSPFINGVTANPSKGRAWVCDHTGLYPFTGSIFAEVPASYEQTPDWSLINFNAPQNALSVKEYPDYRLVVVRAPIGPSSTVATHLLAWDYTNGFTPGKIKYCGMWNLADNPGIGDIEIVMNPSTKIKELWLSRSDAAGDVKRQKSIEAGDATTANPQPLYDDQDQGIDWAYKMLPLAMAADGVQQIVGFKIRERGQGQINVTANSFDEQRTTTLDPISATENSLAPGQRFLRLLDEQTEVVSLQLDNGAVAGAYAYWAAVRTYFLHWMTER